MGFPYLNMLLAPPDAEVMPHSYLYLNFFVPHPIPDIPQILAGTFLFMMKVCRKGYRILFSIKDPKYHEFHPDPSFIPW
jgi:hypothetical protein